MRFVIACLWLTAFSAQSVLGLDAKFVTMVSIYKSEGSSYTWWGANYPDGCARAEFRFGKGILVTIRDNQVTRCDTLPERPDMSFPQFSFSNPDWIVYWLYQEVYTDNRNNGWNSSLRIMNLLTGAKRDLLVLNDYPVAQSLPQWPAGDWVYYQKPGNRDVSGCWWIGSTGQIWRVNVTDTSRREMVVDYTTLDNMGTTCCKVERWNTTPDARIAHVFVNPYTPAPNWHFGQCVHRYPPPAGQWWATGTAIGYLAGCNGHVSPSGDYACHFRGAVHQDLHIAHGNSVAGTWEGNINVGTGTYGGSYNIINMYSDIGSWLAGGFNWANQMEHPKWSNNSDRWMTLEGNYAGEQAEFVKGSNAIALNYSDKQAIKLTNNPRNDWNQANNVCFSSPSGDLFVEGGPANHYQKMDGSWVNVPIYPTSSDMIRPTSGHQRGLSPSGTPCEVYTLRGRFAGTIGRQGTLPANCGMLVVRDVGPCGTAVLRAAIRR